MLRVFFSFFYLFSFVFGDRRIRRVKFALRCRNLHFEIWCVLVGQWRRGNGSQWPEKWRSAQLETRKQSVALWTFWRRNYFFNCSTPVYKMWIIQEPNTLELWNKLHFEERKKRRVYTMLKIFSTYICWINIYIMWIIQEPNTLELWNKLHFEEKKRRVYTTFEIFGTYICWINIYNVNKTGTKYVRIVKQTAFWREKTESIYHV